MTEQDEKLIALVTDDNMHGVVKLLQSDRKPNINTIIKNKTAFSIAYDKKNDEIAHELINAKYDYERLAKKESISEDIYKKNLKLLSLDLEEALLYACENYDSDIKKYGIIMGLLQTDVNVDIVRDNDDLSPIIILLNRILQNPERPEYDYIMIKKLSSVAKKEKNKFIYIFKKSKYAKLLTNENLYDPDSAQEIKDEHIEFIAGPMSLYILCNGEKIFYLFGDVHAKSYNLNCDIYKSTEKIAYIPKFLKKIFLHNKKTLIDIFLEIGFTREKKSKARQTIYQTSSSGVLQNISYEFSNCLVDLDSEKRKECLENYSNVRFHLGDFRSYVESFDYVSNSYDMNNIINNMNILFDDDMGDDLHIEYLKFSKLSKNFSQEFWDYLMSFPKMQKNYNMINDSVTKKKMREFFYDGIKEITLPKLSGVKDDDILMIGAFVFKMAQKIMDLYVLCRVFKRFSKKTENNPHEDVATKIIIVAGNDHIESYVDFLTNKLDYQPVYKNMARIKTGFDEDIDPINTNNRCVNINNIPQNFFENNCKELVAKLQKNSQYGGSYYKKYIDNKFEYKYLKLQ
jgi:hypothetical protein